MKNITLKVNEVVGKKWQEASPTFKSKLTRFIESQIMEHKTAPVSSESSLLSPEMLGAPLSSKEFKSWIKLAEKDTIVDITEAREKWEQKRKQLETDSIQPFTKIATNPFAYKECNQNL